MKVCIQTSIAGHADPRYDLAEFSFRPGEEVDVHDDLGAAWITSGVAVPVKLASDAAAPVKRAARSAAARGQQESKEGE